MNDIVKCLSALVLLAMTMNSSDAETPEPQAAATVLESFAGTSTQFDWFVVNDNVMGGRSNGGFAVEDGALRFTGATNTNGGGFSSIRSRGKRLDLSAADGIRLRVLGDGRRYTWRLSNGNRWRGIPVGYWAEFPTKAGEWITVDLPFEQFYPQAFGRKLEGPEVDQTSILEMGIMIYDGEDGPFELQISEVASYNNRGEESDSD